MNTLAMTPIAPLTAHDGLLALVEQYDRDLYDTERAAPTTPATPSIYLTTRQGYIDALALMGEWWAGALAPVLLAGCAPFTEPEDDDAPRCEACWQLCPSGSDYAPYCSRACEESAELAEEARIAAGPPPGKRHPVTSAESQTYIDTGEWPDAGALLPPRHATEAEIAERLARATALLGEPRPLVCEGERDAENRACCEGEDVQRVTYVPYEEIDPCVALWCSTCRINAELCLGHTILRREDAA
jgi:hypothetical protein